jgi:hypothetical protein
MAPPVTDYLRAQGYKVRSEAGHCDIAAVRGDELVVVELKRSLTLALVAQAVRRQKLTPSVYLAIPRPANKWKWLKATRDVRHLLRRLELGLILVAPSDRQTPLEFVFHPQPFQRRSEKRRRRALLDEINGRSADYNRAGISREPLVTAYRERAVRIAVCLLDRGPSSPRDLVGLGTGAKTQSILRHNVYGWFARVERGVYTLSPTGRRELENYPELLKRYRLGPGEPDTSGAGPG